MRPSLKLAAVLAAGSAFTLGVLAGELPRERFDDRGFVKIFDGKSLDGWHVSGKTGHGTGGKWVVEDGAIVGSQDRPGNGGIILTDKPYGDFEVALEMRTTSGRTAACSSGATRRGRRTRR